MGDSHFKSNVKGFAGTETISNFASVGGTALAGTTVTGTNVIATSYITVGTNKYIFSGAVSENSASIVALASALVGVSKKGSIYMGDVVWGFDTDGSATQLK